MEEIDARHPALLTTLANHPGVGFVLVRSEKHGGLVLGANGAEVPLDELDENPGPLADFGPGAADAVRRTHAFPHTADIMVNSWYDPPGAAKSSRSRSRSARTAASAERRGGPS